MLVARRGAGLLNKSNHEKINRRDAEPEQIITIILKLERIRI